MQHALSITSLLLCLSFQAGLEAQSVSGPATPPHLWMDAGLDSGYISNPANQARVVYSQRIKYAQTAWLQFGFGEINNLPKGSFVRMTSKLDGGVQRHDALTLMDWANWSASFNGDEVLVELVAGPNTKANRITMDRTIRGLLGMNATPMSICGTVDNRTQSTDKRQGRLWLGCTGWLIGPTANGLGDQMLSAGHCVSSSAPKILELNVPNSSSTGSLRRSAPNDQYPYTIVSSRSGGVGNDWQVALLGANSNTGLIPTQANGGTWYNLGAVPASVGGQTIRVTGYGTSSVATLTQVQKTHIGPLAQINSASLCYTTDTTGGNSGSPVIDGLTGDAVGIHTHGGCGSSGGCNSGTRIDRPDLQLALGIVGKAPGKFSTFAAGCQGTGQMSAACVSLNATGGTLANSQAPNEYAYLATAVTPLSVTGFSLYSESSTGSAVTVATAIYGDSGGSPSATPLATGTVTIGATPGFYTTTLNASIPAGPFYIAVDHTATTTYLSTLSSGTPGIGYWRRSAQGSGSWAQSGIINSPSYKVLCAGGGSSNAVPMISESGKAMVNETFSVDLTQAKPSAVATLFTGFSKTSWQGGSLPLSLAPFGAAGCSLLVDPVAAQNKTASSNGEASISFQVPNQLSLVGVKLYHQWWVIDAAANNLGVAVTSGGETTLGG